MDESHNETVRPLPTTPITLILAVILALILWYSSRTPNPGSPAANDVQSGVPNRQAAQRMLDALWRVEAATSVGVTYGDYCPLVAEAAFAHLKWTREYDPHSGFQFTKETDLSAASYALAQKAWGKKIKNETITADQATALEVILLAGAPDRQADFGDGPWYKADDIIQGAWENAKRHTAEAAAVAGLVPSR